MTPLAHRIMNDLASPKKDRKFIDHGRISVLMDGDVHCFECTSVLDAAVSVTDNAERLTEFAKKTLFLPAPKTWIEYKFDETRRATLLVEKDGVIWGFIAIENLTDGRVGSIPIHFTLDPLQSFNGIGIPKIGGRECLPIEFSLDQKIAQDSATRAIALLGFINTPRIIGRKQHMPHAGLQRKMAGSKGMTGKFPLHAWTEILLDVNPHKVGEGGLRGERLTGERALHFCRTHLRLRLGQLELVRAHWRGDPSLGVKNATYRVIV